MNIQNRHPELYPDALWQKVDSLFGTGADPFELRHGQNSGAAELNSFLGQNRISREKFDKAVAAYLNEMNLPDEQIREQIERMKNYLANEAETNSYGSLAQDMPAADKPGPYDDTTGTNIETHGFSKEDTDPDSPVQQQMDDSKYQP